MQAATRKADVTAAIRRKAMAVEAPLTRTSGYWAFEGRTLPARYAGRVYPSRRYIPGFYASDRSDTLAQSVGERRYSCVVWFDDGIVATRLCTYSPIN